MKWVCLMVRQVEKELGLTKMPLEVWSEDGGLTTTITPEELLPLLRASQVGKQKKTRRVPVTSDREINGRVRPSAFGTLWEAFLERHHGLKTRSVALASCGVQGLRTGLQSSARCLYVCQGEYAVVGRQDIDYIASDDATTCHILALREPSTGVVGLAHLDTDNSVRGLPEMERKIFAAAGACHNASTLDSGPHTLRLLDVFLVGGYMETAAEGLSGTIMRYLATSKICRYSLQVARLSATNTVPHPEGGFPSPACRSLGMRLCDGAPFTGVIPEEMRGPGRALRSARLWAIGGVKMPLVEVNYSAETCEIEVMPFSFALVRGFHDVLLGMDDAEMLLHTSTSPDVEGPNFPTDVKAALSIVVHTSPEQHFTQGMPARFPVPLVHLYQAPSFQLDDEPHVPIHDAQVIG